MLNLMLTCFVFAAVLTPSATAARVTQKPKTTTTRRNFWDKWIPRRDVCDPFKKSQEQPKCNFPSVRVPSVNFQRSAYQNFCGALRDLTTKNATLKRVSPYLCVCKPAFRRMLYSCSSGSLFHSGEALGLQFWMLNAVSSLEMGNGAQKDLAMKLKSKLGMKFFQNLNNNRDDARIRICDCLPKLKSYYRSLLKEEDKTALGKCVIMTGIVGLRKALTLVDAANKPTNKTVMDLEKKLCPVKGCCVIRGTYVRNFTVCNRTIVEKNGYGAFVSLPKNVCERINTTIQSEVRRCGAQPIITISKSRMAKFYPGDGSCRIIRKDTTSLSDLANRIRNFTAGMCDSANLLDKSCVTNYIRRLGTFKTTKGRREANITSSDDSEWSSQNASITTVVRNTKKSYTIGLIKATKGGRIQVETTDSSSESSVDYVETDGSKSKLFSKLKKFLVKQRMDLNGGDIETQTGGEIQVDGVFTAKGGVNFTAARLRLVNAAVFQNRLTLKSGSKIQCEGALLLDGTELDGPKTSSDFSLNCNKTTATIISGRGKTNVIRVTTKSVKVEVNNGSLSLEADSTVTTVVTTPGGVLKIQKSSTLEAEDVDGDGDLEVDATSTLRIIKSIRGKLRLRAGAKLIFGKSGSKSSNATGPDTSTIDADVDVANNSTISFEGRQCRALKNLTLGKLAKMVFKMRTGDKLGGNDSEPLVAGGGFRSMMDKNDSIEVDIDWTKFCQLKKRIYLIRMTSNVTLPRRVKVILSGVRANCTRRRLQTQECNTVMQNGQFIVDCTGGATAATTSTTSPNTGTTTASGGTTASGTTKSPASKPTTATGSAAYISTKLVFLSAIMLTTFAV